MKRSSLKSFSISGCDRTAVALALAPSPVFKIPSPAAMAIRTAAVSRFAVTAMAMDFFSLRSWRAHCDRRTKVGMTSYPERAQCAVRRAFAAAVGGGLFLLFAFLGMGRAQSLTVLPVNIQLASKQKATTLTVINQGDADTSIQIRAYAWSQHDGTDQLAESNVILISPPLATLAPGASQIVRLLLRHPAEGREESYRILLDQIPPPAEPGVIRVVLRMSIPVFALPSGRAVANLQFHFERAATQMYLVASNSGPLHESFHDLSLWTDSGLKLKTSVNALEYVLGGSTRRWPIAPEDGALLQQGTVRLKAIGNTGPIAQQVRLVDAP